MSTTGDISIFMLKLFLPSLKKLLASHTSWPESTQHHFSLILCHYSHLERFHPRFFSRYDFNLVHLNTLTDIVLQIICRDIRIYPGHKQMCVLAQLLITEILRLLMIASVPRILRRCSAGNCKPSWSAARWLYWVMELGLVGFSQVQLTSACQHKGSLVYSASSLVLTFWTVRMASALSSMRPSLESMNGLSTVVHASLHNTNPLVMLTQSG